jgi:hypothetical protein
MYTQPQPKVKECIEERRPKLWARNKFGELSKLDYVATI